MYNNNFISFISFDEIFYLNSCTKSLILICSKKYYFPIFSSTFSSNCESLTNFSESFIFIYVYFYFFYFLQLIELFLNTHLTTFIQNFSPTFFIHNHNFRYYFFTFVIED